MARLDKRGILPAQIGWGRRVARLDKWVGRLVQVCGDEVFRAKDVYLRSS